MASDSTILEKVNALRRKGNEFISRKKYKEAVQSYSQSLHLISNHYPLISRSKNSSPSTTSSTTSLPSFEDPHGFTPHMVFSNRSHAYLALGNGIASLNDAEHAIRWNPLWSKGYLRKAEALKYLCRYDESISLYYRALEHVRSNLLTEWWTLWVVHCIHNGPFLKSLKETLDDSKALIESRIHATSILLDEQNLGMRVVQLLPGRDIAISSWSPVTSAIFEFAKMMQNFVYVIGCEATKKCVLVDVCWWVESERKWVWIVNIRDVDGILQKVRQLGFSTILGTIVTHGTCLSSTNSPILGRLVSSSSASTRHLLLPSTLVVTIHRLFSKIQSFYFCCFCCWFLIVFLRNPFPMNVASSPSH